MKRVLSDLDENNSNDCIRLAKKISFYDSIQMIDSAWKLVSQSAIGNYIVFFIISTFFEKTSANFWAL